MHRKKAQNMRRAQNIKKKQNKKLNETKRRDRNGKIWKKHKDLILDASNAYDQSVYVEVEPTSKTKTYIFFLFFLFDDITQNTRNEHVALIVE